MYVIHRLFLVLSLLTNATVRALELSTSLFVPPTITRRVFKKTLSFVRKIV